MVDRVDRCPVRTGLLQILFVGAGAGDDKLRPSHFNLEQVTGIQLWEIDILGMGREAEWKTGQHAGEHGHGGRAVAEMRMKVADVTSLVDLAGDEA